MSGTSQEQTGFYARQIFPSDGSPSSLTSSAAEEKEEETSRNVGSLGASREFVSDGEESSGSFGSGAHNEFSRPNPGSSSRVGFGSGSSRPPSSPGSNSFNGGLNHSSGKSENLNYTNLRKEMKKQTGKTFEELKKEISIIYRKCCEVKSEESSRDIKQDYLKFLENFESSSITIKDRFKKQYEHYSKTIMRKCFMYPIKDDYPSDDILLKNSFNFVFFQNLCAGFSKVEDGYSRDGNKKTGQKERWKPFVDLLKNISDNRSDRLTDEALNTLTHSYTGFLNKFSDFPGRDETNTKLLIDGVKNVFLGSKDKVRQFNEDGADLRLKAVASILSNIRINSDDLGYIFNAKIKENGEENTSAVRTGLTKDIRGLFDSFYGEGIAGAGKLLEKSPQFQDISYHWRCYHRYPAAGMLRLLKSDNKGKVSIQHH